MLRLTARYADASPMRRLPLGVPQYIAHGDRDEMIPFAMGARLTRTFPRATLVRLAGVGQFTVEVDPAALRFKSSRRASSARTWACTPRWPCQAGSPSATS